MQQITTTGKLPHGLSVTGVIYTGFVMREALLADMIEAEVESGGAGNQIHYAAQLAVRQLVKVTDASGREYAGPFVVSMIRKRGDFVALRTAQLELDKLGNAEPSSSENTGTPSS
ncbi:hypothetical protein [Pseudomonas sp. 9Ag]|uniref:hypothetical protein n=1 Tax=Pseudomonas sp. 9Ag TaxID=2653167 RepID=UPI0012F2984F|nr:hypothetical protein [Pseudomonas sp. 9Ag]VXD04233.1 conserved hypothetical protein [Pseudomonas sp. 9Ag]